MKMKQNDMPETNNETMSPEQMAKTIRRHMLACGEAESKGSVMFEYGGKPLDQKGFVDFCREYLGGEDPLPDAMLKARLDYFKQDGKLKSHLPAGYRCCVAVLPITHQGHKLSAEEVEKGAYQVCLIVEPDQVSELSGMVLKKGRTMGGSFAPDNSYLFHLLPAEVQSECTFTIEPYKEGPRHQVDAQDRDRIIGQFEKAFRNAQKIFNKNKNQKDDQSKKLH